MHIFEKDVIDSFPSLEVYKENLQKLKQLDFESLNFEEKRKAYFDAAILLPRMTGDTSHTIFKENENKYFYRARLQSHNNLNKEDTTLIQNFSFPPSQSCTKNGRANMKNTSVFYCSNSTPAAFNEIEVEVGSEGFLGVWEMQPNVNLEFNLLISNQLNKTNTWYNYIQEVSLQNQLLLRKEEGDLTKHLTELRNFINDIFMYEKAPYSISSFIANRYLYGNNNVEFIVYPSAKSHHNYVNYAFHPNVVINSLKLSRVFMFRINNIDNNGISFTVKKVGYLEKSHIKWKSQDKSDEKFISHSICI